MKRTNLVDGKTNFIAKYSAECGRADVNIIVDLPKILGNLCPLEILQML